MPVKRRNAKRRLSEAEELFRFEAVFASGFDFFGDLGFGRDYEAARKAAREAWPRLGARFLAECAADWGDGNPWALQEFGAPNAR